jgi:predicted membrane protein
MQSKKMSIIETILSTAIGFIVSLILVNVVLPLYGFDVKFTQSITITIIFTVASILRGYFVRRVFNHFHNRHYIEREK